MHTVYLQEALNLAHKRRGFCAPNPSVGAIVVKNHRIIGSGIHEAPGAPHAEIMALRDVDTSGATLYVTLEPCTHDGRTPPCVPQLIDAGLKAVYFGYFDPNPHVSGGGQQALHAAGLPSVHCASPEINTFYRSYAHWLRTGCPWITAKLALTLDGKIAGPDGQQCAIAHTPALDAFTHHKRKEADAVLTTAQTISIDNPALNARTQDSIVAKKIYVLDRHLRTPQEAQIFRTAQAIGLFYVPQYTHHHPEHQASFNCIPIEGDFLTQVKTHMGQDGMHDVWVEVGGRAFGAMVRALWLDAIYVYLSPRALGAQHWSAFTEELDLATHYHLAESYIVDQHLILYCVKKTHVDAYEVDSRTSAAHTRPPLWPGSAL